MNLSKTQEIISGLVMFDKYLTQLTDQFQGMKVELINAIQKLIQFLHKQLEIIEEEKKKHEKPPMEKQFNSVFYNFKLFHEQLQQQLSKISNQIEEQISSIQTSDYFIWLGQQCNDKTMNGSLVLIDDEIQQDEDCLAIAFNRTGTIMASGCGNKIKVWNFNNRSEFNNEMLREITTLVKDETQIISLIFSKNSNSFLSGSINSINMWHTQNDQSWENVNSISNEGAYCMILNQLETKLYAAGNQSISVWDINFEHQKLQCKLNLQVQKPYSLSVNEEETYLVACSGDQSIIVWKIQLQAIKLYQIIYTNQNGHNLCFITNTQFIWLPEEQHQENCIYVYDLQNGDFQQQEEKQLHLLHYNSCYDSYFFPIVFNKETKIIAVRHKVAVYLIQAFSNGTFKIITQKQFQTDDIYGTMTNDGRYLVLWDNCNMKYQIYEIEIQ